MKVIYNMKLVLSTQEYLDGGSGGWLLSGPTLTIAATLEVNQQVQMSVCMWVCVCVPLQLCVSTK